MKYRFYMQSEDGTFKAYQNDKMAFECELNECLLRKSLNHNTITYTDESIYVKIELYPASIRLFRTESVIEITLEEKVNMAKNLREIRMRIHEHALGNYMAPILEAIAVLEYQLSLYQY